MTWGSRTAIGHYWNKEYCWFIKQSMVPNEDNNGANIPASIDVSLNQQTQAYSPDDNGEQDVTPLSRQKRRSHVQNFLSQPATDTWEEKPGLRRKRHQVWHRPAWSPSSERAAALGKKQKERHFSCVPKFTYAPCLKKLIFLSRDDHNKPWVDR